MFEKICKIIDVLLKTVLVVIVAAFIVIVFAQVIARYVFNNSLSWSEELARVLFTQMIFLAIPLVVKEKRTISVDIIVQFISVKAKRPLYVVLNALSFVFFGFLAVSGYRFAMMNFNQRTAALHLNVGMLYLVIPVSAVLMMLNVIRAGIDDYCVAYAPGKEEKA